MFHDLDENRDHYNRVLRAKPPLYFERFDTQLLKREPLVADLLETAFARMFPAKAGELLDLGCGTGFYFPLLSRHADSVTGVDVCVPMLQAAEQLIAQEELKNCRVLAASALELPFANGSMDVIHSWDLLHHLSDVPKAINEITRVLKPGGRYIAFEPNLMNPSITWYHLRRRSEWRLFLQNQFSVPRQLRREFDVTVRYDNTIISFLNQRTKWLWNAVDRFTSVPPLDHLRFRYVIDAIKQH